ncbi:YfhO family protein [Patescibacteria group bacterium]
MIIFTLLALFITFFYKIFFLQKVFFLGDNLLVIAPHKAFLLNSLKQGVFPLWNPNMWAGFPEYADSTLGLYNPFNLVYLLFPNLSGITIAALLSYFLAFLGTFLFLKNEGLKKNSALIGAVIFAFSGSMINISLDIIRLNAICFLPWILLAIKKKNLFWTTILLSFNILAGQFQHFYMPQFFIFGYLVFFTKKRLLKKTLLLYFTSLFLSMGLTFFALWPQINFIQHTTRDQAGLVYNTIWSLHPASLIRFFLADFWGRRIEGSFWGPNVTYAFGYIGFFPLLFILTSFRKHKKRVYFLLLMAIFALLIAFGKYNPFYNILLLIPGMSLFRNPSSWLVIYSFSLACLTAYLTTRKNSFQNNLLFKKTSLFLGLSLTILGGFMLLIYYFLPHLPHEILVKTTGFVGKNLSAIHTLEVDRAIAFLLLRNFLILGILSLILSKWFKLKIFLIVIFLDLLLLGQGDLFLGPKKLTQSYQLVKESQHIQYLNQNIESNRLVSISEFIPLKGISTYHDNYFRRPPFFPKDFWILNEEEFKSYDGFLKELTLLPPNFNLHYNLPTVNGYSSFVLKDYQDYFKKDSENLDELALIIKEVNASNPAPFDPTTVNFDFIGLDDPRIASLSVKFVVSDQKLKLNNFKENQFENNFYVYENKSVLERAQIINQDEKVVNQPKVVDVDANTVFIDLTNTYSSSHKLVLRDIFYPGWKAFDNKGNQLTINKYQIFRSVDLNEDIKSIRFKFMPSDFIFGLKTSLAFLALFATLLFFKFDKKIFFQKKKNR